MKYIDDLDADPILIAHTGRLAWQFPSGRIMNVIRGGDEPDPPKTFTQAEVDQLIADRLKRAKAEPPADYDKLKADAAELATLKAKQAADEAKNKTAEEQMNARLAALEADIQKANERAAAADANALAEKRRSAIVAAAATQKAANPDQVAALLKQDAVTIGDDGQVTGADEAVKAFLADNPHFVGKPATLKPDMGQGKTGDGKPFGQAGREEAARRFGTHAAAATTQ